MTPGKAIAAARSGELLPVYLVLGEERLLQSRVLEALRAAVIGGVDLGLNEDHLVAGEVDVDRALDAARTLPMMASSDPSSGGNRRRKARHAQANRPSTDWQPTRPPRRRRRRSS
jgi:DNA polymerase III delta subunit